MANTEIKALLEENERLKDALGKIAASTRLSDIHSDDCEICKEARIAQQALKEQSNE